MGMKKRTSICEICDLKDSGYCPEDYGRKCEDKMIPLQCLACGIVQTCQDVRKLRLGKCRKQQRKD